MSEKMTDGPKIPNTLRPKKVNSTLLNLIFSPILIQSYLFTDQLTWCPYVIEMYILEQSYILFNKNYGKRIFMGKRLVDS